METCCELQKLLTMKVVELLTSRGITKKEVRIRYLLETVIVGRFGDTSQYFGRPDFNWWWKPTVLLHVQKLND